MSIGAYLSTKAEIAEYERNRKTEYWEIEHLREREIEEIREIYIEKGFAGELLEQVVEVIIADDDRWVDVMMKEELGLTLPEKSSRHVGLSTLVAFIVVGLIPLLTYVISSLSHLDNALLFPLALALTIC